MKQRQNFDFGGVRWAFLKDQILIKGKSGVGGASIKTAHSGSDKNRRQCPISKILIKNTRDARISSDNLSSPELKFWSRVFGDRILFKASSNEILRLRKRQEFYYFKATGGFAAFYMIFLRVCRDLFAIFFKISDGICAVYMWRNFMARWNL